MTSYPLSTSRCLLQSLTSEKPRPGHEKASQIFHSVKPSPSLNGLHHLGNDGVLRSFSSRGDVVDFKQLGPDEIDTIVRSLYSLIEYKKYQQLVKVMEGVDGRDVTDMEQILHPGPELRPLQQKPSTDCVGTETCPQHRPEDNEV
jgi:hypothetical protein